MASEKMFKIVGGPSDLDLIVAYFKGPTNHSGGFRATFTIAHADGKREGHTAFEVHSFTRVPSATTGHMIVLEGKWNVSSGNPCPYCGCAETIASEHACRLEGFYDTQSRVGFLSPSDFQFTNYFTVEPGTKRVLRISQDRKYFDAITGELVVNPRLR